MIFNDIFLFTLPTKIFHGYHSVDSLGEETKRQHIEKALVVTDQGVRKAGVLDPILKSLENAGVSVDIFDKVPMDPGTEIVDEGCQLIKKRECTGIIVVGGGSPICAGKAMALVSTNGGNIRDYEGFERFDKPPLPVIAIPTTAGSGSEVSSILLMSDETRNSKKMVIGGYNCYPEVAFLDPILLRSLPPMQCIISGMDALTHAIEAIWTNLATPVTDVIAYEAIRLIMKNLSLAAYSDNLEAKGYQLLASTMANIACGNAKLGIAHGMSEPMESYPIPHGLSLGILLPYTMEYNLPVCEEKLAKMADVIGVTSDYMSCSERAKEAIKAVKALLTKIDFPDRIPEELVPKDQIPSFSKEAIKLPNTSQFNIRKPTEDDLIKIYEHAFRGWR